jgi:uncharacterized protein (TIGR02466 family)
MILCDVFPTAIAINQLKIDAVELASLLSLADDTDNFVKNKNNFFHNDVYLLDTMPNLAKAISNCIDDYTINVLGEDASIRYTQSWININPPGASHHRHSHINSILSGVLYLQTDEASGRFLVHRSDTRTIKNKTKNFNKFNFEYLFFEPKQFELYLFPSSLEHSVEENKSNKNRISLSFNTFYHGTINATDSMLTELKIN